MSTQRITAFDRCDVRDCSAQAYVIACLKAGGELYFCRHHARQQEAALRPKTMQWVDWTHLLEEAAATQ